MKIEPRSCDKCAHCADWHDGGHLVCTALEISFYCQWMREPGRPCAGGKLWKAKIVEPCRDGIVAALKE